MATIVDPNAIGEMCLDMCNRLIKGDGYGGIKLNMKVEHFVKAVMMISTSNNCKALFVTPVNDHYSHTYDIVILESNARIIDDLIKEGYSLSMSPKGLVVNKY